MAQEQPLGIIKEEAFEGTLKGSLALEVPSAEEVELQNMFAQLEENDQNNDMNFGNPQDSEDDFNEDDHAEILNKLSLMDKENYIDLLKQSLRIKKMREQLVLADLDDDKSDLKRSKSIAAGINAKHKNLVSAPDLKLEYDKLESKYELNEGENVQDENENIEY